METKTCCRCRGVLPVSEFGPREKSKDKLQSLCKTCNGKQSLEYYYKRNLNKTYASRSNFRREEIRKKLSEIKVLAGCYFCDEKVNVCLDFHHIDQNEKDFVISRTVYSLDKIIEEVQKCEIVCANCHRKIHAEILEIKEKRYFSIAPLLSMRRGMKKGKQKGYDNDSRFHPGVCDNSPSADGCEGSCEDGR